MQTSDFKKLCSKIQALWGENSLNEEKSSALWTYCKNLQVGEASDILTSMLEDDSRYFTPAVFAGRAVASEKERNLKASMVTREKNSVAGCRHCQGGGQLVAYRREDSGCCGLAFRCTFCRAADQMGLAPQIVPWRPEYSSEFELMTARNDRLYSKRRETIA